MQKKAKKMQKIIKEHLTEIKLIDTIRLVNTFTTTLITVMAGVSFAHAAAPSAPAPTSSAVAARKITINKGQTHLFELPSNSTTGYSWQLDKVLPKNCAADIQIAALPQKPNNVVGVPTNSLVTITGQHDGVLECKLVYKRMHEQEEAPKKSVSLIITVR